MFGHILFGPCPSCRGPQVVPVFSTEPVAPVCLRCAPEPEPPVEVEALTPETRREYAVRLSANVGSYQMALLDGDQKAADAFLANVAELCETLRR